MPNIRTVAAPYLSYLKAVIDSTQLFPSELLDDMLSDYLNNEASADIWLTQETNGQPIAVAFCAHERMTEGTYNLYLIAVHKDYQAQGVGGALITYLEQLLKRNEVQIVLVETSGLPEYELTRKFYDKCGYSREAVIRDFYKQGEDKLVFWKKLN